MPNVSEEEEAERKGLTARLEAAVVALGLKSLAAIRIPLCLAIFPHHSCRLPLVPLALDQLVAVTPLLVAERLLPMLLGRRFAPLMVAWMVIMRRRVGLLSLEPEMQAGTGQGQEAGMRKELEALLGRMELAGMALSIQEVSVVVVVVVVVLMGRQLVRPTRAEELVGLGVARLVVREEQVELVQLLGRMEQVRRGIGMERMELEVVEVAAESTPEREVMGLAGTGGTMVEAAVPERVLV